MAIKLILTLLVTFSSIQFSYAGKIDEVIFRSIEHIAQSQKIKDSRITYRHHVQFNEASIVTRSGGRVSCREALPAGEFRCRVRSLANNELSSVLYFALYTFYSQGSSLSDYISYDGMLKTQNVVSVIDGDKELNCTQSVNQFNMIVFACDRN